jgi:hypothetical protein
VYHLELRKFPHTVCRFNQGEQQLRAIVVPWVREEWIEEGERGWNMHEATLTVLEGPELSMGDLTMGRGWRNAQRVSKDVTESVLAAAMQSRGEGPVRAEPVARSGASASVGDAVEAHGSSGAATAAREQSAQAGQPQREAEQGGRPQGERELLADSLGLHVLGLLDAGPVALSEVWALARQRLAQPTAAESLALGEQSVRSLLQRRLGVLQHGDRVVDDSQAETLLRSIETWSTGAREATVIARKT